MTAGDDVARHYALFADSELVAAIVQTERGWRCRSNVRNVLQHDYVCHEPIGRVRAWMDLSVPARSAFLLTDDRKYALAHMRKQHRRRDGDSAQHEFLVDVDALAAHVDDPHERILCHLERGW